MGSNGNTISKRTVATRQISEQRLVTARQFCERLGMSYEWGRKQIQRRQIAFVQIGRSVRIPEAEIDRFIAANFVPVRDAG